MVLLDVPTEVAAARLGVERDRMEAEPDAFHQRVREGFRAQAEAEPDGLGGGGRGRHGRAGRGAGAGRGRRAAGAGAVNGPAPVLAAEEAGVDLWGDVVGQPAAVAELRAAVARPVHAYLLVGPRGSGKRALARAFAAALLSRDRSGDDAVRHARLALAEAHPDLTVVERQGASITAGQADEIVAAASRSSVEGGPKVLVLDEFHLVTTAAPKLLKSIEEPPAGTVFLVLADEVPPDLVTIASRCVRVDLGPVPLDAVVDRLEAEGVSPERAAEAAAGASGDLSRARLLATDERLALRRRAWHDVPDRLDGTGSTAVEVADELLATITDAMAALSEAQAAETAELEERVKATGERGSGRRALEERHKREARRYRTDELRAGLTELASRYRAELATAARPGTVIEALEAVGATAESLVRNPNERLQLVDLLSRLGRLR